jgi:hypothetical protein
MPGSNTSASSYAIDLDGAPAGVASKVTGGSPVGTVVKEKPGPDSISRKHLGGLTYEDLVLGVPLGQAGTLQQWINSVLTDTHTPKNGVVRSLDYRKIQDSELSWTQGLITQITFPECSASSKEHGTIDVTIRPESTRFALISQNNVKTTPQKPWLRSNFRLQIDGLPCNRVSHIDALIVIQPLLAQGIHGLAAGPVEIPNLVFSLSTADQAAFFAWFKDFALDGNNGQDKERNGTLDFLGPDLKSQILTLDFKHLGIFRISGETQAAGDAISHIRVEMYCEGMSMSLPGGGQPPGPLPPAADDAFFKGVIESLRGGANVAIPDPQTVAHRLIATVVREPQRPQDRDRLAGQQIGDSWARNQASLQELATLSQLDAEDWQRISLPPGHSLIRALAASGTVDQSEEGPITLNRDDFVEGLVASASSVYRQALPNLSKRIDYHGSEFFLRTDILKPITVAETLVTTQPVSELDVLRAVRSEALSTNSAINAEVEALKSQLDFFSQMSEMESLSLQMLMDRKSRFMSALSNMMKKISDTEQSITSNLK